MTLPGAPGPAGRSRPVPRGSLTTWSLGALLAALLAGAAGHASGHPAFGALAAALGPFGALWMAALQMVVLPLVVTQLLAAVTGAHGSGEAGALSIRAVILFVLLLVAAGLFAVAAAPPVIALYPVDPDLVASLQAATPVPDAARHAAGAPGGSIGGWVGSLLPRNLLQAALDGNVLAVLVFTVLLGTAVTRLPGAERASLTRAFQALADAMLILVRWLLLATPAGVFVLTFAFALRTGGQAAGILAAFVVIVSGLMLLFTAILYPATALLGRTGVGAFARAAAPAQLVAVSTRSSIAALPALLQGAREHLRLPATATSLVLPLSVSLFKVNRTISSPVKLFFLAHVYGIPLAPWTIAVFLATVVLLSFTSVGLPGGGAAFRTLPAYLAAGMPIEGVVILEAVDTIPDIFKTLLNVTGDMSAATLLTRSSRAVPGAVPLARAARSAVEARTSAAEARTPVAEHARTATDGAA